MKGHKKWLTMVILVALSALVSFPGGSPAGTPPAGWLAPDEVTPARVKLLCQAQKWEVTEIEGGLRVVDKENNKIIIIMWEKDKKIIFFTIGVKLKGDIPREKKLAKANEINNNFVLTRAFIDDNGNLRCDYSLRYVDGLSEAQIMNSLVYFLLASFTAIKEVGMAEMMEKT